jgi:hypothetical protein
MQQIDVKSWLSSKLRRGKKEASARRMGNVKTWEEEVNGETVSE